MCSLRPFTLALLIALIIFSLPQAAQAQRPFVTVWDISRIEPTLTIPTTWETTQPYDFTIDWGDGTVDHITGEDPDPAHTYALPGTYTVQITGTFPRLVLGTMGGGRQARLRDIAQWGDIRWESMERAFLQTSGLAEISATDAPDLSRVTNLAEMFRRSGFNGAINHWDVSNVQAMEGMFSETPAFNQPLDDWDVSRVTNMERMFHFAQRFNQPIGSWDVSRVQTMAAMFSQALVFNQPIGDWNVSRVTNMSRMFAHTVAFNQPISTWSTRRVERLHGMFEHASAFNQPIETWDLSSVTSIAEMFAHATSFNQPLADWDVSKIRNLRGLFQHATSFNQPLADWDVSQVYNFSSMLEGAAAFDQDLSGWQVAGPDHRDFSSFLRGATLSTAHYDALLIAWAQQELALFQTFHAGNATYSEAGRSARVFIRDHFGWVIQDGGTADLYAPEAFVTTWTVQHPQTTITIPTNGQGVSPYDFTIDWGDGTVERITGEDPDPTHTFDAPGAYTVHITGTFPRLVMGELDIALSRYLSHVRQWGHIAWERMDSAFERCTNLQVVAEDAPDLSRVTSLHRMFSGATKFNADLRQWDVSNVTDMSYMFERATAFNQPLNTWDVSEVTTFAHMFDQANAFNQPLGQWDTRAAQTLAGMFSGAHAFNQDVSSWDVSNVTTMEGMFRWAYRFNQSLALWQTTRVRNMNQMFRWAYRFNQPLGDWDVSGVESMEGMFQNAGAFNQPLYTWDMSKVRTMEGMFWRADVFDQPIGDWDVSSVTNMASMFESTSRFNQSIGDWDVSNVTTMKEMFSHADAFNQPLSGWDMSSVVHGRSMFSHAKAFNQPIADWTFAEGADLAEMFKSAEAFDQCLGNLKVEHVSSVRSMLERAKLSTANYDCTLNGWAQQQLPFLQNWHAGMSQYSEAAAVARQHIIDTFGWQMLDGGLDADTSNTVEVAPEIFAFVLKAPYPNPSAHMTTLVYTLPADTPVFTLIAYDLLGRVVTTIRHGTATPGKYEAVLPTASLPSGTYFIRLTAGSQTQTRTLVVAR